MLWLVLVLCTAWGAFRWNVDGVFYQGGVYFTDGDCYARMTRVLELEASGIRSIRYHAFENHPTGIVPHTTLPLDGLILGMSMAAGVFRESGLEFAGAWISPVLGLLLVGALTIWGAVLRLPYRYAMGVMLAVSPILAHGFQVGRPDHQSLLVLLVGVALAAEVGCWQRRGKGWAYGAAIAWALAMWVSLFEPLVLLGVVLSARGVQWFADRGPLREFFGPGVVFLSLLGMAAVIDWREASAIDPAFMRWAENIGELRQPEWAGLFSWCGWLLPGIPVLLVWRAFRGGGAVCGLWAGLTLTLIILAAIHARWGYFLALAIAMALPFALPAFRRGWLGYGVFIISLWPVASNWEETLFPGPETQAASSERLADAVALRDAALSLRGEPDSGVVAPWWFSPAVVWWSGKPCVGGTSHQSLPGTLDTCRVYLAETPDDARRILTERNAQYVITYDPERVIGNSSRILGVQPPPQPFGSMLHKATERLPEGFERIHSNRFFKVHRIGLQDLAQPE